MIPIRDPHPGACHCGAVRFEVRLKGGLASARRCDCSFCRMRGAVAVSAARGDLTVTAGEDALRLYQFGTRTAEHHFCGTCGIYVFHRRRSNPDELGINLACLEGQHPFLPEVAVNDGINHPSDGGGGIAGVLRYEARRMPDPADD